MSISPRCLSPLSGETLSGFVSKQPLQTLVRMLSRSQAVLPRTQPHTLNDDLKKQVLHPQQVQSPQVVTESSLTNYADA